MRARARVTSGTGLRLVGIAVVALPAAAAAEVSSGPALVPVSTPSDVLMPAAASAPVSRLAERVRADTLFPATQVETGEVRAVWLREFGIRIGALFATVPPWPGPEVDALWVPLRDAEGRIQLHYDAGHCSPVLSSG